MSRKTEVPCFWSMTKSEPRSSKTELRIVKFILGILWKKWVLLSVEITFTSKNTYVFQSILSWGSYSVENRIFNFVMFQLCWEAHIHVLVMIMHTCTALECNTNSWKYKWKILDGSHSFCFKNNCIFYEFQETFYFIIFLNMNDSYNSIEQNEQKLICYQWLWLGSIGNRVNKIQKGEILIYYY